MNLLKKIVVGSTAAFASVAAFADVTAATTAIAAAQTDALAVSAAMLTMGIAVWGASYLRRKFFR